MLEKVGSFFGSFSEFWSSLGSDEAYKVGWPIAGHHGSDIEEDEDIQLSEGTSPVPFTEGHQGISP